MKRLPDESTATPQGRPWRRRWQPTVAGIVAELASPATVVITPVAEIDPADTVIVGIRNVEVPGGIDGTPVDGERRGGGRSAVAAVVADAIAGHA